MSRPITNSREAVRAAFREVSRIALRHLQLWDQTDTIHDTLAGNAIVRPRLEREKIQNRVEAWRALDADLMEVIRECQALRALAKDRIDTLTKEA